MQSSIHRLGLYVATSFSMLIMAELYFHNQENGEIIGGTYFRLFLKILAIIGIIYFGGKYKIYSSKSYFFRDIILFSPFLIISLNCLIFIDKLDNYYLQSLNLIILLPLLFIEINNKDIYNAIFKSISYTTIIQIIVYPIILFYYGNFWENGAVIGTMGNPNVFGLFLIISSLYFTVIEKKYIPALVLSTFTLLTGSLASAILGLTLSLIYLLKILKNYKFKSILVIFIGIILIEIDFYLKPLIHIKGKLNSLVELLFTGNFAGSTSVEGRVEYITSGYKLMEQDPLSFIFGHPMGIAMYNGDGLYISYMVTYGLIFLILFIINNFYLVYKNIGFSNKENVLSVYIILVFLYFFLFNRILDYWPCAIPFLLSFRYLMYPLTNQRRSYNE